MKLKELLVDNNLFLSDKGRLCLIKVTLEMYPMLLLAFEDYDVITNAQLIKCVLDLDFREDQIKDILSMMEKYSKLWSFS